MTKKRLLLLILSFLLLTITASAQFFRSGRTITFHGVHKEEAPAQGIGLDKIIVFENLATASISFTVEKSKAVSFYTYENSSSDKNPFTSFSSSTLGENTTYTLTSLPDNRGLILDDGLQLCYWIIDYSQHKPILNSISPEESDDRCEVLKLLIDKSDLLEYRGTGGQLRQIDRKYDISYEIEDWDDEKKEFQKKTYTEENLIIGTEIILDRKVPNIDTHFKLRGDQFGKHFNSITELITPDIYKPVAVEAHIVANQRNRNSSGEGKHDSDLGGSAPVDIEFLGYANEAAEFYTWFIYNKNNMDNPIARYTDQDIEYTFDQHGEYEVILEVANAESTCVKTDSRTFSISESMLDIPNYFSPGSSPGINDEWRVVYKSLVKYKCTIFNRWGNKVFESRDPAQGWDGRYKGSLVHPGVYYYVIEATGSEGKRYKEGGDINILK